MLQVLALGLVLIIKLSMVSQASGWASVQNALVSSTVLPTIKGTGQ